MRRGLIAWGAGLAVLVACGPTAAVCDVDCPAIAGTYRIISQTTLGACPFTPYLLGPTLALEQSPDGRRVSAQVIDPVQQLPVLLAGEVFRPRGDDPEVIGSFRMFASTRRAPSPGEQGLVALDVTLTGTVATDDEGRHVTGSLTTFQIGDADDDGCQVTFGFTGREAGAPAALQR